MKSDAIHFGSKGNHLTKRLRLLSGFDANVQIVSLCGGIWANFMRRLRQSLCIRFVNDRQNDREVGREHPGGSLRPIADIRPAVTVTVVADELTEHDLECMNLGQRARGWIVNSYAQFEHLLLDLVVRAKAVPDYGTLRVPYRTDKRIAEVKRLCAMQGPLEAFSGRLIELIDRFEAFEKPRLLLVHGFCAVSIDGVGNMSFNFKRYRPTKDDPTELEERTFTLRELQIERNAFVQFAREAMDLFVEMHRVMGWEGLHLPDPVE